MKAILELFERRYWARIWTAQEILFAKSIFVLCGGSSIKWEHFHWIYSHLDGWRLDHDAVFNKAELRRLWRSSAIRSIARKANWTIRGRSEDWSLRSLISKYKHMESTDPRDMVYALLSLCKDPRTDDSTRTAIVADYSKSTVEVYADALNHIRRSEEDPDSHHFQLCITQLQTALRLDLNDPAVQRETLLCFPKLNYFRFRRFSYTLAGRTRSVGPVSWSLETLKLAQSPRYRLSTETEPSVPFSMTDPLHSLAKAKQHPNETWAMRIFAKKLEDDDQLEEAVELRKRLFEKRRRENFSDPETLGEMIDLAFRLRQLGQDEEATKMCEDILGSIKGDLRRGE
jgi:hypothetical protein